MRQNADILIRNITVYTQDEQRRVLPETDVAIREGKIAAIGKLSEEEWTTATVLDGTGKALFPGMQNLHVHIFQSLLKGLGADLNLIEWLKAAPLRGGPAMTDSLQRLACKIAAMESLKCGVTTLSDFNYVQNNDDLPHACIETMEQVGIRGIYMDCYHDTGLEMGVNPGFIHPAEECIRRTDALRKKYEDGTHPLIRVWAGASVPWGTTEALYREMVAYSNDTGVPYTMHILETEEDNLFTQKNFGKSVVETMESFGALTDRLLAVHCVCLKEEEIAAFVRNGVNACYCPTSNAYLGSGIPPMASMLHQGVNITMGTDGAASNNSSDMIESLKIGLLLQKVGTRSSVAMSAQNMLDFTTVNAAKAAHRSDLGSIEVGKLADMFIYDPIYLRSTPNFDTLATLMYNSSQENVETTIVGGRIVYHKNQFACGLEEKAVAAEADREAKKFLASM